MRIWTFMVLSIGLLLLALATPAHSAGFNCKGLAKVHVNVWSYSQCSLPLSLHFENFQAYSPYGKNDVNVDLGPGEAAKGPLNSICRRQVTWEGMINFGYSWYRNPAYPNPSSPSSIVAMAEGRWRLTRMSRNGRPITSGSRVLRFRQTRDVFVTIEDGRLTDGTCIDGDFHIACFQVELPDFPDLSATSTCTTKNGSTCLPRPASLCGGCNEDICPR